MTTRTVEGWTLTWVNGEVRARFGGDDAYAEASADGLWSEREGADGAISALCPRAVVDAMFAMLDEHTEGE